MASTRPAAWTSARAFIQPGLRFDVCALLYREPALGLAAHRQHAGSLAALYSDDETSNPSYYGVHLTRRPRGLPFWFALAVHGTDAFAAGVERVLAATCASAAEIRARPVLELAAEPELSVLALPPPRVAAADYERWTTGLRESGTAFVLPSTHGSEPVARFALVKSADHARRPPARARHDGRWLSRTRARGPAPLNFRGERSMLPHEQRLPQLRSGHGRSPRAREQDRRPPAPA